MADSLESCASLSDSEPRLALSATQCLASLMQALESLAQGKAIQQEKVQEILAAYPEIGDADYKGKKKGTPRCIECIINQSELLPNDRSNRL